MFIPRAMFIQYTWISRTVSFILTVWPTNSFTVGVRRENRRKLLVHRAVKRDIFHKILLFSRGCAILNIFREEGKGKFWLRFRVTAKQNRYVNCVSTVPHISLALRIWPFYSCNFVAGRRSGISNSVHLTRLGRG